MTISEHHDIRGLPKDEQAEWLRTKRKKVAHATAGGSKVARRRYAREITRKYKRMLAGEAGHGFKK